MAIKRNLSFPLAESKFDSTGPIKKAARKSSAKEYKKRTGKNKPIRIDRGRKGEDKKSRFCNRSEQRNR